jgi:hypothetical protein
MENESTDEGGGALGADEVRKHFTDQTLLTVAQGHASFSDSPPGLGHVVSLHNAGEIDLLEVVGWPAWAEVNSHAFFAVQQYLNRAIPQLDASPARIMAFTSALVERGGADGAAMVPYDALRQWFQQRPDQAREVCAQGQSARFEHLICAIQGLGDLGTARTLVGTLGGLQQRAAIDALSRIRHPTALDRAETIQLLDREVIRQSDDDLRGAVLNAVALIFNISQMPVDPGALALMQRVLGEGGDNTLSHAARALLGSRTIMTPELMTTLLCALKRVDPGQHGTINLLDIGLSGLLRAGHGREVVDFLTTLLTRSDFEVPFTRFDSVCSALWGSGPVLGYVMGRWLSSGMGTLCLAVEAIFNQQGLVQKPVEIDLSDVGLSNTDAYFACRKAIAFLFIHPIVIACFHVAALRVVDAEHGEAILELLFEPLLTNYGGSVYDYLASLPETDPIHPQIKAVLSRGDAYVEGLRSAGEIKELWPPEQHMVLEYHRRADEMRDVMKGAHKQSIFADIFKRSTLLYGNRSVSYVEGPGGERRRFDIEMKPHSITQEWPRTETIDPVGLQEMLFALRIERRS